VQLADESLYFSSIDTNEIVEQVIESANIDVSTQITENEIKQDVEVVDKLKTHDLRFTTAKPKARAA
jgi:soluble P-type ATPase